MTGLYSDWTPDEIAECVEGITMTTYHALWTFVMQDENEGREIRQMSEIWDSLDEATQANVTESIAPMIAEMEMDNKKWGF